MWMWLFYLSYDDDEDDFACRGSIDYKLWIVMFVFYRAVLYVSKRRSRGDGWRRRKRGGEQKTVLTISANEMQSIVFV